MRHRLRLLLPLAALACLLVPASASAFQKAIWGTPVVNGVNQFPMYHKLGVTIDEVDLDWDQVAPTRPKDPTNPNDPAYQWPAVVSQAITDGRPYHIQVLIQIRDAPAWANGGHTNPAWAPKNPQDFANFAAAAAKHYSAVKLWMIWGEPTRAGNFYPLVSALPGAPLGGDQLTAPHLYARILNDAYGSLKAVSRKNIVIGGCTWTRGALDPLQWIANLRLPDGKPPRMDMYAHNPFTYVTPTTHALSPFDEVQATSPDLHELAGWINKYLGKNIPMFFSEFTIPTQEDDEFNYYVNPNTAAKWITEILRECRSWKRIYGLGWINVYDDLPTTGGGLLTANGTPKPSYYAFEHG
jgi:hypothetical protein